MTEITTFIKVLRPLLISRIKTERPKKPDQNNITLHSKNFEELDKGIDVAFKFYTSYYAQYGESAMQNVQVIHPDVSSL